MSSCLAQRKGSAVATVHKGVPELSHAVSERKMIVRNPASRCNPVHELGHGGMTSPARNTFPELAQCDLENREHPNQVGSFEILIAVTDIA